MLTTTTTQQTEDSSLFQLKQKSAHLRPGAYSKDLEDIKTGCVSGFNRNC